jgi:hypothetical protein
VAILFAGCASSGLTTPAGSGNSAGASGPPYSGGDSGSVSGSVPEAGASGSISGSTSGAAGSTGFPATGSMEAAGAVTGVTSGASGSISVGSSCTPGISVACEGAGGCSGGQACNADGTGFGTCVCAVASSSSSGSPCLSMGTVCASTPNACCSGVCESDAADPSHTPVCAPACTLDSDCEYGCCALSVGANAKSCAPRGFCPTGGTCTSDAGCQSGCCAPFFNTTTSVCSAPQFCDQ